LPQVLCYFTSFLSFCQVLFKKNCFSHTHFFHPRQKKP
jgi:hypothetical protein